MDITLQKKFADEKDRNLGLIQRAEEKLMEPLGVLNNYLAGKDYLVANKFCIANINVAGILSYARDSEYDFSPYKNVTRYLDNILSRPARKKAEAA